MSDWISTFPGYRLFLRRAKKTFGRIINTGPIPKHVGIIMDGNRRYAKNNKIELKEGHSLGFDSMSEILELLYESGIECATVYAFSIENFKRLSYEVKWLMDLAKQKFRQISQHGELCDQYGIRIKVLGNTKLLPQDVQKILQETEEMTKSNNRAVLNVCFPYTSRDEITHLIKEIVKESTNEPDIVINETTIDQHLYTAESPPLDLMVRTSGTSRLSDFLLWQCVPSTCAIVFVDKLWPEFTTWDMCKILVNWGFNSYWYGASSGYSSTSESGRSAFSKRKYVANDSWDSLGNGDDAHDEEEDEDEDEEEDEEEEDQNSDFNSDFNGGALDDEIYTVTSDDESDANKGTPYKTT